MLLKNSVAQITPLKFGTTFSLQIIWQALFARSRFHGKKFRQSDVWRQRCEFFNSIGGFRPFAVPASSSRQICESGHSLLGYAGGTFASIPQGTDVRARYVRSCLSDQFARARLAGWRQLLAGQE
jgi:hypothetical protein